MGMSATPRSNEEKVCPLWFDGLVNDAQKLERRDEDDDMMLSDLRAALPLSSTSPGSRRQRAAASPSDESPTAWRETAAARATTRAAEQEAEVEDDVRSRPPPLLQMSAPPRPSTLIHADALAAAAQGESSPSARLQESATSPSDGPPTAQRETGAARAARVKQHEAAAWNEYWEALNEHEAILKSWKWAPASVKSATPPPVAPGISAFLAFCSLGVRSRADAHETTDEADNADDASSFWITSADVVCANRDLRVAIWAFARPAAAARPAPPRASSDGKEPYMGCAYHPWCTRDCECLTADCVLRVRDSATGRVGPRRLDAVRVGDDVATCGGGGFRRVLKLWPSRAPEGDIGVVNVAAGCRVTPNHPVFADGRWRRAGDVGPVRTARESVLFGVELEGHVDTLLVGAGVVVAAIGVYCGLGFAAGGWNVFTRKSVRCDRDRCSACDVCVDESLDFSRIRPEDLDRRYTPYAPPPPDPLLPRGLAAPPQRCAIVSS